MQNNTQIEKQMMSNEIDQAQPVSPLPQYMIYTMFAHRWIHTPPDQPTQAAKGHLPNLPRHIAQLGLTPEEYLLDGLIWQNNQYQVYRAKPGVYDNAAELVLREVGSPDFILTDWTSVRNLTGMPKLEP